jgi:triacylglycerol lipase
MSINLKRFITKPLGKGIVDTTEYSETNASLFAQLSEDCYLDPAGFKHIWGHAYTVQFIEGIEDGAEAYALADRENLIFVFRGTEPTEWKDIKADCKFFKTDSEVASAGKVHRGFKDYLDRIWDQVHSIARDYPNHKIWVTGHSLGAAMATLAGIRLNDCVVYNYGSPRVGNNTFAKAYNVPLYRHRNNNDVVTRNPLEIIGYSHVGEMKYFDSKGKLHDGFSRWRMFKQWCSGTLKGICKWPPGIDGFSDHSMSNYTGLCKKLLTK